MIAFSEKIQGTGVRKFSSRDVPIQTQSVSQSVSQSVNSQSHPALTPPPALRPAPLLPFKHKYRVFAPGGYSIVASEVNLSLSRLELTELVLIARPQLLR